ncbi:RHS repeat domain-containing protein, partial [Desulfovibrio gilichinskyi]
FFATNQVGTIFMVADERGNEVKRIINDSFGNLLLDSGVSLDICLGFAAGLADKDTGLVHLGYREYDPAIGRFTTPDPLGFAGGDVDVYGYCLDDPINFHDRTGLAGKSEGKEDKKNTLDEDSKIKNLQHDTPKKTVKHAGSGMDLESSEKISPKEKTKLEQDNKSKFSLKDLGKGAFKGIRSGIPAGMTIGSALGPLGITAGAITGGFTGASVGMLYSIGSKAISDTFGIDEDTQKTIRKAMGYMTSKKGKK